ncbi:MAG: HlyD family efflux transporter periplasmic adaptor subunit [Acidobacteria bacterium]|nr:HlyD family efflux transporter periplasmic adaptor subunit [Acidobacteriota bacterium]
MKKAIFRLFVLAILAGAGWGGYRYFKSLPERQDTIPNTKVQRGDVVIRAYSRGELKPARSITLTAPNLFGTVQVTDLAPMGSLAREKDLIVEYDDSERQSALEEARLSVQSVDEQIKKAKADLAIQQSQDQVTLLRTRYNVRRAELDVKRNPILAEIDGKKNVLTLEQQKRALVQLETDIQMRNEQAASQLAVLNEQRNRSLLDVQRELTRIAQCKSLAPMTGLVAVRQNRAGNFNFGQTMPDIRVGDTLQPGMPVADIMDLSEIEIWAKVGELDRANLKEGQAATIQLDAVPEQRFRATIKALSGTATTDVFSGDPSKKFDVVFSVDMRQLLGGLGMKPADIQRILDTAAANAKKAASTPNFGQGGDQAGGRGQGRGQGGFGGGRNADSGGGQSGGDRQSRGGDGQARGGDGQARGQGGGSRFANLSEADRAKMQELRQKMQSAANDEDRAKVQKELQDLMAKNGITFGGRGGDNQGRGGAQGASGAQGGFGGGGRGQGGGRSSNLGDPLQMFMARGAVSPFTEEERKNAKLPLPPEEDSQVQVLLRPGLLADVEIEVEKIPNVLHVPAQAVFNKGGKYTVFVQDKNGRFAPREVRLVKQSESMMVLSGGVEAGEVIAMADPTAPKGGKNAEKKGSANNPMGGMPASK